eukprot:6759004-Pyramimonas_sp.AAC.1
MHVIIEYIGYYYRVYSSTPSRFDCNRAFREEQRTFCLVTYYAAELERYHKYMTGRPGGNPAGT